MSKIKILLAVVGALLVASPFVARAESPQKATCPVSGKEFEVGEKTPRSSVQGKPVYFCCENCPRAFTKKPEQFVKTIGDCPVLGQPVTAPDPTHRLVINNGLWYTCCPGCIDMLNSSAAALKELTDVVSGKKFKVTEDSPKSDYQGQAYYFAAAESRAAFEKDPGKYAVVFGK
jgi:YHS domain-containing protein